MPELGVSIEGKERLKLTRTPLQVFQRSALKPLCGFFPANVSDGLKLVSLVEKVSAHVSIYMFQLP